MLQDVSTMYLLFYMAFLDIRGAIRGLLGCAEVENIPASVYSVR